MRSLKKTRLEISQNIIKLGGRGPVLVHSDVMGALGLIEKKSNSLEIISGHLNSIEQIIEEKQSYFPTFNYNFPSSKHYDVKNDVSQVGTLSEYYRKHIARWRSSIPIFNVCGKTPADINEVDTNVLTTIDPFGPGSFFDYLYKTRGVVLFYGARIESFTGIHFAEQLSGGPLYRYDKIFTGDVSCMNGQIAKTKLKYHVRPLGRLIQYDFDKIWDLICEEGLGYEFHIPSATIKAFNFHAVVNTLLTKIANNPFFMLSQANASIWEKEYNRLGRRVIASDFEHT
jgi:aminoglycoside N3'-acetyltransferase